MKALVTGGNGFIGRYIVEQLLARGDTVHVVGRGDYPALRALGAVCFRADLAAEDDCGQALRGCEVVFHVAAMAGVWGRWSDFYRNNVSATQHILRSAARADVPKFVFTSSPSVVFGDEAVEGADETRPYPRRYLAAYPYTKALAEQWVLGQHDVLTTAIRPPLVWGPRDPHLFPRLLARARAGQLARVGDGTNRVDVTYVENAAEAHLLAAAALDERGPVRGRAYFIGQERPVNLWEFVNTLLAQAGAGPVTRHIPFRLALALATGAEWACRVFPIQAEPRLTRLVVAQLARSRWFDLSAARRDLGYGPRITIEEGLRRTAAALAPAIASHAL